MPTRGCAWLASVVLWGAIAAAAQSTGLQAPPEQSPPAQSQEPANCAPPQEARAGSPPGPVHTVERRPESEPPNARLTTHQKWVVFLKQTYSPYTGISAGFDALIAQASGSYYSYGGGMQGFGKRYGASLANYESGAFFGNFLYPTLFHQDPRYIAARQGGVAYRAAHAASRVLVTTGDSGRSEFNYSFVLSAFTGSAITNAYYPRELRGFGNTMSRGGGTLLGEATTNLLREFWPDIRRHLRRHEPEKIRKLEQSPTVAKITQAMTGGPQTASCPAPPSPEQPSPSSQGSKSRGGFWTPGP